MRLGATSLSVTKPGAVRKRYGAAAGGGGGGTFPDLDTYSHVRFEQLLQMGLLDVHLSNDGTKIWYLMGNGNRTLFQKNLSTPFDVSTVGTTVQAQKDLRFSFNNIYRYIQDIYFKPDGTRLYGASYYGSIITWTLSTAFDISTASYDSNLTWVPNLSGAYYSGITFKSDGTKMYWADPGNDRIYQKPLSTAWDPTSSGTITSSPYLKSNSALSEDRPWGLQLSPDGTKIYVLGSNNDKIFQANLSTPWDISSSSWDGTADYELSYSSYEPNVGGFHIGGPSGQHLYLAGYNQYGIDQFVST